MCRLRAGRQGKGEVKTSEGKRQDGKAPSPGRRPHFPGQPFSGGGGEPEESSGRTRRRRFPERRLFPVQPADERWFLIWREPVEMEFHFPAVRGGQRQVNTISAAVPEDGQELSNQ